MKRLVNSMTKAKNCLNIHRERQLASYLKIDIGELRETAEFADNYIDEFTIWSASGAVKPRDVINVRGRLRTIQHRLLERLFRPNMTPSPCSHGGVRNRHVVSNAEAHLGNQYYYLTDISSFYPTISNNRVNRFFLRRMNCSPIVARYLTRLCTYRYHLALGLITSPILADQLLWEVDQRIVALCDSMNLTYTRFVDDITISGKFDLSKTTLENNVEKIFQEHGFKLKPKKSSTGFENVHNNVCLPGVRIKKDGRLDVHADYICEVERIISDHSSLAKDGEFYGPLMPESQLAGKIHYALWVNPGRRLHLMRRFKSINWSKLRDHAFERELVTIKKKKTARHTKEPSFESSYGPHADLINPRQEYDF